MLQRLFIVLLICASPYILGELIRIIFGIKDVPTIRLGIMGIVFLFLVFLAIMAVWRVIDYIITGD